MFAGKKWISNVKHKYDLRKMGQQAAITTEKIIILLKTICYAARPSHRGEIYFTFRRYLFNVEFDLAKKLRSEAHKQSNDVPRH